MRTVHVAVAGRTMIPLPAQDVVAFLWDLRNFAAYEPKVAPAMVEPGDCGRGTHRQFPLIPRYRMQALGLLLLVSLAGCGGTVQAVDASEAAPAQPMEGSFRHELLDQVLSSFVDDQGMVDYVGLKAHPETLKQYLLDLSRYSPKSHPELFPTDADRLAYQINAHNAFVLYGVIQRYPLSSVNGVKALIEIKQGFGFFFAQKFVMGNETINLYNQVNRILRKFGDPRIHAALNCGALGCPRLRRQAFHPETLHRELDEMTRNFFAEGHNLRVEDRSRTVYLSKTLDWFDEDFTQFGATRTGRSQDKTLLLDYAILYTAGQRQADIRRAREGHYRMAFLDYDWRLNAQGQSQEGGRSVP